MPRQIGMWITLASSPEGLAIKALVLWVLWCGRARRSIAILERVESTETHGSREGVVRWTREQIREMFSGLPPPTADDVPITRDGRRLDTPEKVRAFLDEL
ncbi:MAG: hypothetical protein ACRD0G_19230, partial [Acidimicrobiales bacterium]